MSKLRPELRLTALALVAFLVTSLVLIPLGTASAQSTADPTPDELAGPAAEAELLDDDASMFQALTDIEAAQDDRKARPNNPFKNVPVTGKVRGNGTFTGRLNVQRFSHDGRQAFAHGTLHGIARDANGKLLRVIPNVPVTLPVDVKKTKRANGIAGLPADDDAQVFLALSDLTATEQQPPACPILNLVLGPVHLDLLGLVIDLDTVTLNIVAQPGPGKLLGNLLCAIAHLLDEEPVTPGQLAQLIFLLMQLLNLFGG